MKKRSQYRIRGKCSLTKNHKNFPFPYEGKTHNSFPFVSVFIVPSFFETWNIIYAICARSQGLNLINLIQKRHKFGNNRTYLILSKNIHVTALIKRIKVPALRLAFRLHRGDKTSKPGFWIIARFLSPISKKFQRKFNQSPIIHQSDSIQFFRNYHKNVVNGVESNPLHYRTSPWGFVGQSVEFKASNQSQ